MTKRSDHVESGEVERMAEKLYIADGYISYQEQLDGIKERWRERAAFVLTLLVETRKDEREQCALAAENVVPRHTECGNRIAAAIRARGEG